MIVSEKRPRNLGPWHAGPLLFGDWGTSRLYVLGLAVVPAAAAAGQGGYNFAAPGYLLLLSLLMAAVAWAYTVICRSFPDGGGVYTAARQLSPLLSVIGATLLLADYLVTAAISLVEAFHYFGVPEGGGGLIIYLCCIVSIAGLGLINWFGARSAGRFALIIAVMSIVFSAIIGVMSLHLVPAGLRAMEHDPRPRLDRWIAFTGIILALSGVEAVANMTGLMRQPVAKTARRTIWPVLGEVAVLNLLFGVALVGLLAQWRGLPPGAAPFDADKVQHAAMKVLAISSGQHWMGSSAGFVLGKVSAFVFGLLLVSAANTAIMAMVSVAYSLAQDRELPRPLCRLNYSGVPWIALLFACAAPVVILTIVRDLEGLADLYAIGVVGAITLSVASCALNKQLSLRMWTRAALMGLGVVMAGVWVTIAATKIHATIFAFSVCGLVLAARYVAKLATPREAAGLPEPELGWLAEIEAAPAKLASDKPRIMLAARGRANAEYAVEEAKRRGAVLFVIYVRTLRLLDTAPGRVPRVQDDRSAQEALGTAALLARQSGVQFFPIYVTAVDIAAEILDYAVTFGCDTLIMGKTRRSPFARVLEGDVVAEITRHLPEGVTLVTR